MMKPAPFLGKIAEFFLTLKTECVVPGYLSSARSQVKMFELIPSLLVQQNAKQATVNPPPSIETTSVTQQKTQTQTSTSTPLVAIPEATPTPESTLVKSSEEKRVEQKKAAEKLNQRVTSSEATQSPQGQRTIMPQILQSPQVQDPQSQREPSQPVTSASESDLPPNPSEFPKTPIPEPQFLEKPSPKGLSSDVEPAAEPAFPPVRVSATPVTKLKPLEKTASKPKLTKKPASAIARSTASGEKNVRSNRSTRKITASAPLPDRANPASSKPIKSSLTLPKVRMPVATPTLAQPEKPESEVQQPSIPEISRGANPVTVNPVTTSEVQQTSVPEIGANPLNSTTTPEQPTVPTLFKSRNQPVPTFNPRRIEMVKPSPAPVDRASVSTIRVSKPSAKAIDPKIAQEQQLLEQRLAEIVAKDRAAKQAKRQGQQEQQQASSQQQREALIRQAYDYATQRRFDRARQILQDPNLSQADRDPVLVAINDLEIASRSLGITKVAEAKPKPQSVAQRAKVARIQQQQITISIPELPPSRSPKTATVIPVPRAPLFRSQRVVVSNPLPTPMNSDAGAVSQAQVVNVNPQNLQAYNRHLPGLQNQKDKLLYPLPEPVPVTSKFGWRIHPVTRVKRLHAGVDLGAAQGTPILASRSGRVAVADRMGGYGLTIVLQHNDGSQDTLYAHLSQLFVRPGERIQPGMVIGKVGSTGVSTGPHLHYEARSMTNTGWVAYDPGPQIEAARVRLVQARQIEARSLQSRPDKDS
jgi:murein DD-endopeptidase MepM/ murein hydrolase activator NlpD